MSHPFFISPWETDPESRRAVLCGVCDDPLGEGETEGLCGPCRVALEPESAQPGSDPCGEAALARPAWHCVHVVAAEAMRCCQCPKVWTLGAYLDERDWGCEGQEDDANPWDDEDEDRNDPMRWWWYVLPGAFLALLWWLLFQVVEHSLTIDMTLWTLALGAP